MISVANTLPSIEHLAPSKRNEIVSRCLSRAYVKSLLYVNLSFFLVGGINIRLL